MIQVYNDQTKGVNKYSISFGHNFLFFITVFCSQTMQQSLKVSLEFRPKPKLGRYWQFRPKLWPKLKFRSTTNQIQMFACKKILMTLCACLLQVKIVFIVLKQGLLKTFKVFSQSEYLTTLLDINILKASIFCKIVVSPLFLK